MLKSPIEVAYHLTVHHSSLMFFLHRSVLFMYGGVYLKHQTAENYTCNLSPESSMENRKTVREVEGIVGANSGKSPTPLPLHLGRFTVRSGL